MGAQQQKGLSRHHSARLQINNRLVDEKQLARADRPAQVTLDPYAPRELRVHGVAEDD